MYIYIKIASKVHFEIDAPIHECTPGTLQDNHMQKFMLPAAGLEVIGVTLHGPTRVNELYHPVQLLKKVEMHY